IVYTLAHLGTLWGDGSLLEAAERYARRIATLLPADREQDVVAGAAGAAAALLSLHRANGSAVALEVAHACGEHLLRSARPRGGGSSRRHAANRRGEPGHELVLWCAGNRALAPGQPAAVG